MNCYRCGADVPFNAAGLNRKLISRECKTFLCINCLGARLGVTAERLEEKIKEFQSSGCMLFIKGE